LIADDNKDAADSLAVCIELDGYAAFVVYDGAAAVSASVRHRPSVVILDLDMPKLDGYGAATSIRSILGQGALLIALTALGDAETKAKCRTSRFDHHLSKGCEFNSIRRLVADRLAA